MTCDIIIPIWNQLAFTRDCIENIIRNTRYPYRLILIDNASDADMRRYLENLKRQGTLDIELIRNEENLGFVRAVNQGLKASRAPFACVMNNDTIPAPGWLERMIEFANGHPDVGLINPQCDGHGGMSIDSYAKRLEADKGKYMEMNQCQGFCMLIKRELIEKIGYLDEAFGIGGYDDTDYSMRAHLAGYKCVAIRDAYVYHRLHGSFNKSGDREKWVRRNQKLYYDKWGKHLRVGIAASLDVLDIDSLSHLVMLTYGLAREWSWVHLWLNFMGDEKLAKKSIDSILGENDLPPHQNIRINYFNVPKIVFKIIIATKFLERMRRRMQDKRIDALIAPEDEIINFISPIAKVAKAHPIKISLDDKDSSDWQKKGKELALSIKEMRK